MIVAIIGALAIAAGTWFGGPTLAPVIVGVAIGLGWPRYAARRAAMAGVLGWSLLLVLAVLRGDALATFSATLGGAMNVPGWVLFLATLAYPAILASSAAWLAQLIGSRRTHVVDSSAPIAR